MAPKHNFTQEQFEVPRLGPCERLSPLQLSTTPGDGLCDFTPDDARILYEPRFRAGEPICPLSLEHAGARQHLFFDPAQVKAAIVTCGGLSPGINNVVRTVVLELIHNYGVPEVLGIRYGYEGLNAKVGRPPINLTPEVVENIHHHGGTILGTSRGPQQPSDDGRLSRRARRQHAVLHRRRRHAGRRARHCSGNRAPRTEDRRRRHPEDDRQRHRVLLHHVRLRHGGRSRRRSRSIGPTSRRRRSTTASAS